MKKFYVALLLLASIAASAQLKVKAVKPSFSAVRNTRAATPAPLSSPYGDTLYQYFNDVALWAAGGGDEYMYMIDASLPVDSGYLAGTNYMGITSTMQQYNLPVGGTVKSLLLGFGKAVGNGSFHVSIWADNAGTPGSVIQTFTVPINQVDSTLHDLPPFPGEMNRIWWNYTANLPSPLTFTAGGTFWAGISAINNPGDTVALLCTNPNNIFNISHQNSVGMIYGGTFYTYMNAFNMDVLFSIFPVIEYPPCKITGNVYNDVNANNIKDPGDTGIVNVKVIAGNYIGYTDPVGNYTVYADSGNYNLTADVIYATEVPASISVSVPNSGSVSNNNNFAAHYIPGIRDVAVKIGAGPFRPGFGANYIISIMNKGTQPDNGTFTFVLDDTLTYTVANPPPATISGDTLTFNYTTIPPGQNILIYVATVVPSNVGIGYHLSSSASVTPLVNDSNTTNNYDTLRHATSGSYDPNEKSVWPEGNISTAFVNAGNYLYYTINFQNTGTDTAFTIKVADTLSSMLNITSLEVMASSHPCVVSIANNSIATFTFNNILLPDSGTNQLKSHGFVSYRIKPYGGLALGSQVKNTAYIYFDFNAPVVTNTTLNTVSNQVLAVETIGRSAKLFTVYPNPFNESVTLRMNNPAKGSYTVKVIDMLGKIRYSTVLRNTSSTIDLSFCAPGCYEIVLEGPDGVQREKVIKF